MCFAILLAISPSFPIIENQIHEQIKHIINKKYNTINAKIEIMKKTRKINILAGTTVENKGKLILTEIFPSMQKHDIF